LLRWANPVSLRSSAGSGSARSAESDSRRNATETSYKPILDLFMPEPIQDQSTPCPHMHGFDPVSGFVILCSREDWIRYGQYPASMPVWFQFCPVCAERLLPECPENVRKLVQEPLSPV